jgi:hypothetical protein
MAVTIAVVFAGKNRLRYLCTTAAVGTDTGAITTTGAATPDIQTDSTGGLLEQIAQVITAGYGPFAAGAQTQIKARILWLSQPSVGTNLVNTPNVPTARCHFTRRTGTHSWFIDANVSGNNPVLNVTAIGDGAVAAGTAYLDIFIPGAIGA